MSILDNSDKLRQAIIDGLAGGEQLDAIIYERLIQLLDEYDSKGGYFEKSATSLQKLLKIETEIRKILSESGYFKAANTFIQDLSKITQNTIDLQAEVNKLTIQKRSIVGIEKVYRDNVVNLLNEGGLNTNFIQPITNAINEATTFGYSIQTTRDNLEKSLLGKGPGDKLPGTRSLGSYLTVHTRDTVSQLQGAQQQAILNEYEMPYVRYIGNIIGDSRGQCVRWKGMRYIEVKQLAEEIENAYKKQKLKANEGKDHPYSGMIPGTNAQNFLIRRGGWGCLHNGLPTRFKT